MGDIPGGEKKALKSIYMKKGDESLFHEAARILWVTGGGKKRDEKTKGFFLEKRGCPEKASGRGGKMRLSGLNVERRTYPILQLFGVKIKGP